MGVLLIGGPGAQGGLDLTPIGMPSCRLYLNPVVSLSAVPEIVPILGPTRHWQASIDLPIPTDAAFLSGGFLTQFANLELTPPYSNQPHVTLSQGLQLTLASQPMTLGMATITSRSVPLNQPFPDTGRVAPNRGPVVRFVYH